MRTPSARVLSLSVALLPLTFVNSARAQAPANAGGRVLSNVGSAVVGQPAAVVPGQPIGYGYPATPGQVLQGMQRQAFYNAAGTVTGQPGYMPGQAAWGTQYQMPAHLSGYAPGTTVNYGGTSYTVNANGTMSPAAQWGGNAMTYQLPGQFERTTPGTIVAYGGASYVVNANGTMSPVPPSQPAGNAVRYQVPAHLSGYAPGTTLNYGGMNYIVNADGTMSQTSGMFAGQPRGYEYPTMERQAMYVAPGAFTNQPVYASAQTTSATQYQLPSQFSETAPGSIVTYGGTHYVVNNGGTMSPAAR